MVHFEEFAQAHDTSTSLISFSPKSGQNKDERLRLVIGMLSAVGGMIGMLSGPESSNQFETYTTSEYRLDYFETVSGYKFVVMSSPNPYVTRTEVRADFDRLYQLLFVPLVIRNPLFDPKRISGDLRDSHCHVFLSELRTHFRSLTKPGDDPVGHVRTPLVQTSQVSI